MRAAIYARKSTEQTAVVDEQKSVSRQVAHATAFARRKGWQVLDDQIYIDDGISGAEFSRRPGFLRLMNALAPSPAFDVLILSEESRLGRESIETAYALKRIISAGVRVFFYLEDRERVLQSPTDKLLMSVTAFADELERDRARQRTFDALYRKALAGHVTGGRVFGYDNVDVKDAQGRRTHVERRINEAQAATVRRIFELAAAGVGYRSIALQLNEGGVPAPRAQRGRPSAWCPSSVFEALHRDLYRGVIVWNRSRKRDNWGRRNQQPREKGDWLQLPAEHLRVVDDRVWGLVQDRLQRRRAAYAKNAGVAQPGRPVAGRASKYLLSGFVQCGCCQGTLTIRTRPHGRRRVPRLACWHYTTRGSTVCANNIEAPLEPLNELILDVLRDEILHPTRIAIAIEAARELLATERGHARQDLDRSADDLDSLDREAQRLTALTAAGLGDLPAVIERLRDIKAQRARLENLRSSHHDTETIDTGDDAQIAELERRLTTWRDVLTSNPVEARGLLELVLVGRINVTPMPHKVAGAQAFGVKVELATSGLFEGILCPRAVASPTGFEPVF